MVWSAVSLCEKGGLVGGMVPGIMGWKGPSYLGSSARPFGGQVLATPDYVEELNINKIQ